MRANCLIAERSTDYESNLGIDSRNRPVEPPKKAVVARFEIYGVSGSSRWQTTGCNELLSAHICVIDGEDPLNLLWPKPTSSIRQVYLQTLA
jgi:hypothetical protein